MFVPNEVRVYGSVSHQVSLGDCSGGGQNIVIHKSHLNAIDQPTQPCKSGKKLNTSACIAGFIERHVGCNPDIHGNRYSKSGPCTTKTQLLQLQNISTTLADSDEHDIYAKTGCLSSCEKDTFGITAEPMKCRNDKAGQFTLHLRMMDMSYEEREEYIIYDSGSFIADVAHCPV